MDKRLFLGLLVIVVCLAGCGGLPSMGDTATPPAASADTPSATRSIYSTLDATPAADASEREQLEYGCRVLVRIQTAGMILDAAVRGTEAGTLSEKGDQAAMIGVITLIQDAGEALEGPAPHAALADAWETARPIWLDISALTLDWYEDEISVAEATERFEPIREDVIALWAASDPEVAPLLGVAESDMPGLREEWIDELTHSFGSASTSESSSE